MTDEAALAAMPPGERAVSFIAQNVWKRAAIVAAGPLANFLLAIVIFTGIFYVNGRAILLPMVDGIAAGSAAEAAGFQLGDRIVSIDGFKIDSFEDMQRAVQTASDTELVFSVDRGGKLVELVAMPRRRDVVTPFGTTRVGVLGVQSKSKPENWHVQNYDFVGSVKLAGSKTWYIVARTGSYLKALVAEHVVVRVEKHNSHARTIICKPRRSFWVSRRTRLGS